MAKGTSKADQLRQMREQRFAVRSRPSLQPKTEIVPTLQRKADRIAPPKEVVPFAQPEARHIVATPPVKRTVPNPGNTEPSGKRKKLKSHPDCEVCKSVREQKRVVMKKRRKEGKA